MTAPDPQPFYFGPPGAGLFGWLHRPPEGGRSGLALVICNPFGFEEVCAHRSLRQLAQAAAEAGVATLRFDYAGCGNSEGDDPGPQQWAGWQRSVHQAADSLKQATGTSQVVLLGVRLGATLAALAAAERDDVLGLIAIAPVVRGRSYLRELTMLGVTGAAQTQGTPTAEGLIESAGFALTRETGAALSGVDLRTLTRPPAPRVLIVERDDMPAAAAWDTDLQRLGAEVRSERWPGYAGMMEDPQRARVPQAIVAGVVACLRAWQADAPSPAGERPVVGSDTLLSTHRSADGATTTLSERALHIDAGGAPLFGVLTRAQAQAGGAQPAVLMLNSGSVHHIGPNRLWVRLARRWALRGVTVLRVDISGIGDSTTRPGAVDNVVYSDHAAQDIAAALDYLQREVGASACHAMGLCSGAYHALKTAVAGQKIASALMINPLTYFWTQGMELSDIKDYEVGLLTAKYRRKLATGEPWKKLLRGQLDLRIIGNAYLRRGWSLVYPQWLALARALRLPLAHDLARELDHAAAQGVRLHFVFAVDAPGYTLLRQQSGRAIEPLVERQQASIDFVPGGDHTFTRLEARERLVALLDERMLAECER